MSDISVFIKKRSNDDLEFNRAYRVFEKFLVLNPMDPVYITDDDHGEVCVKRIVREGNSISESKIHVVFNDNNYSIVCTEVGVVGFHSVSGIDENIVKVLISVLETFNLDDYKILD